VNKCFFAWESEEQDFRRRIEPNGGNESIYVYLFLSLCSTRRPAVWCVIPSSGFCDRDWLFFYFFPEEKKIVGRMERTFTVLVALDSCYLLGRSRKTFFFYDMSRYDRKNSILSQLRHAFLVFSFCFIFIYPRNTSKQQQVCLFCFVLLHFIFFLF
jgi:hypothetical protein